MLISIDVPGDVPVSGAIHAPSRKPSGVAFAIAPGAGTHMDNPLLVAVASGLAERGHEVMRFNFGYQQRGSRRPDPQKKLIATYRAAAETLRARGAERLVIGGKSMGGRMASLLAAEGFACDGLVFLGYPLHPAGKPEQMRDGHLAKVKPPMLFVQGTRDKLCDLTLLRPVLARVGPRAKLHEIAGGDHSFEVLKRDGRSPEEVLAEVIESIATWTAETFS
ncbi:MAG: alpha/beta family hydrolase [Polyangiaceae bacterium]